MKKLILTTLSILMLFTTSLVSTFANKKPTLDDVKAIYNDVFYNYKYDEDLGEQALERCHGKTLKNMFECDVNFIEENKGGVCRQFSNLLIKKLTNIGVKAVNAFTTGFPSHVFVVYELDGKKYVADPVRDKTYNEMLGMNNPMIFQEPLDDYLELHKDENGAGVFIYKKSPQDLNKNFEELDLKGEIEFIKNTPNIDL